MSDDFESRYGDLDFSCELVQSFRWAFFSTGMNKFAEKKIIKHLLGCPKCREKYEQYADKIGWGKFEVLEYSIKYLKDDVQPKHDSWVLKVTNNEIIKLARSKAMREILLDVKDEKFRDFLMLKIAKRLDFLDECYKKEIIKNEKS